MIKPIAAQRSSADLGGAIAAAQRADIAPFIVMDVMRAAAAREAAGERVIHMEVGQPATAAPKAARARVCLLYTSDAADE